MKLLEFKDFKLILMFLDLKIYLLKVALKDVFIYRSVGSRGGEALKIA